MELGFTIQGPLSRGGDDSWIKEIPRNMANDIIIGADEN